jgi:hypothetical protein
MNGLLPVEGSVPWTSLNDPSVSLSLTNTFATDHEYALTMHTRTSASYDSESMRISVSGLQRVPEPATWLLSALGFAAMTLLQRRHHVP